MTHWLKNMVQSDISGSPEGAAIVHNLLYQAISQIPEVNGFHLALADGHHGNQPALRDVFEKAHRDSASLQKDRRGAPYARDGRLLLSASDEDGISCAIGIEKRDRGSIVGIGIDVTKASDFQGDHLLQVMCRQILSHEERRFLRQAEHNIRPLLLAALFSLREAAVKSIADKVRSYEDTGASVCRTDLMDFFSVPDRPLHVAVSQRGMVVLQAVGVGQIKGVWNWGNGYATAVAIAL